MNILVTGGCGQLGLSLREVAAREGGAHTWTFADIAALPGVETVPLDITDAAAVRDMVRRLRIDVLVNCAAYTNVDAAEDNPDLARALNATAVGHLASAMAEVGGLLAHISTDYVFGKEPYNTPCGEGQTGTPTGVYGQTKLEGERLVRQSGVRHVILRTAWLYSEYGKNFVKTMLRLTADRPSLKVVFDQAGTPTYAGDLARALLRVVEGISAPGGDAKCGIYHYSNEGVCSWYDFAHHIADYARRTGCDIQPCHSAEFPSKVVRPAYSVLDKTKVKETFGLEIPYWTDSLRKCVDNLLSAGE